MAAVATSRPELFSSGTEYKHIHTLALSNQPEANLQQDEFAVAVLRHDKALSTCTSLDWLWFKKHAVAKVKSAYQKRIGTKVDFQFANKPIGDNVPMRDLDHLKDNIVVFTSNEESKNASPSSFDTARVPLREVSTQLSANSKSLESSQDNVKLDSAYLSPSIVSKSVTVKDENQDVSPGFQAMSQNGNIHTNIPPTSIVKTESHDNAGMPTRAIAEAPAEVSIQPSQHDRVQEILEKGTPEDLEAEVKSSQKFLMDLKTIFTGMVSVNRDAHHWVQQIDGLLSQKVDTPTIIGVVGNTGAGKSSVINAMLEEERLVPTNCMRACTAVVTEMSWNASNDESEKYRANIEFIDASDWEKDLRISLTELMDGNGQVSRECTNAESEAGIAYAKIKAVYPQKTKEELASSTVEKLMNEPSVKAVLGTVKKIANSSTEAFYRALQHYVDSKEKSTDDSKKKKEKKEMEWWPLIRVVKIYTKAEALSTGAVIVDLPGIHDSNAARAAVAAGYMKQCTGLFIVAPINRAVDDKAAKSLLGESFKRQLNFDNTYSHITFIYSKTDDISITEASENLRLELDSDWEKIDELEREQKTLKQTVVDLKESKAVYTEIINDAEDGMEIWEKLKNELEDGNEVFAPLDTSKKRKRSDDSPKPRKKSQKLRVGSSLDDEDDDFIDDDDEEDEERNSDAGSTSSSASDKGDPLTIDAIESKLANLKDDKRRARREKSDIDDNIRKLNQALKISEKAQKEIETAMSTLCIEGRNKYSKGAIQQDFADGIRELDMESAQEEDPDNFNLRPISETTTK